jgi:hypothetical protein
MIERLNHYMKRLIVFLTIAALTVGTAGCSIFGPRNLEIRTWYDLDVVRSNLGGSHILMNDLDSTTAGYDELASPTANGRKGWQPIGTSKNLFTGIFDGQGYEIRDVFIDRTSEDYVGLFGVVGQEGIVQNVGVVNVNLTGPENVGGLAGGNRGSVSNCYSTGSVAGDRSVGGLVGYNLLPGTVGKSYSMCNITGDEYAGGLVGGNAGTVNNCYSASSVSGEKRIGGLAGGSSGTVTNSYSRGSVTGADDVGGLMGYNCGTCGATVGDSFWDLQTSGQSTSAGGTGRNTTQMKDIDTFSGAGWNVILIDNPGTHNPSYIWNIVEAVTYPFLSWEA